MDTRGMFMRAFSQLLLILLLVIAPGGCARQAEVTDARDLIRLHWVQAYDSETLTDAQRGLLWGLSWLGASLPANAPRALVWEGYIVTLDIGAVGVVPGTEDAWRALLASLRDSDEYRAQGAIDIGRFLALALGSSRHYFALTGAVPEYQAARQRFRFNGTRMAVVQSGVAREQRLIELAEAGNAREIAFVAHEGTGSLTDGSFASHETEMMDFMPNGQLRVALYDHAGHLKVSATEALTRAGKPAKCLWCHEVRLLPAMNNHTDVPGYLTTAEFDQQIAQRMALIEAARSGLDSQVSFGRWQEHTLAELLYLTFLEPTAERVAREWHVTPEEAARRLAGKPAIHGRGEFALLGETRYARADVDALAPWRAVPVAASAREPSAYEPASLNAPAAHQSNPPASR